MSYHRAVMKRAARALGVLLLVVVGGGCGHPIQRKLEGRWIGEGVENFDDRVAAPATGWAKGTSFEFAGSMLTIAIPAEEPRTGQYKVVSVHQNDVALAIIPKDAPKAALAKGEPSDDQAPEPHKLRLKLDDERSMRWMLGDGRAVLLRRD